jgi:hypothetical protein
MTPNLHAIAKQNVEKFTVRAEVRAPIQLKCADALTVPWPDGNVVAYLYNPFDHVLMARFLDRAKEHAEPGRSVMMIYVNPVHRSLLSENPSFRTVFEHHTLCVYACVSVEHKPRSVA